jgi:predicted permease
VVQVALAFVLLCGAGLLGLSLNRALAEPLGFARESILVGKIGLPWKGYPSALHQSFFVHRLEQAVANLPGGVEVAITNGLPFGGFTPSGPVSVEGRSGNGTGNVRIHYHAGVTANYWPTMGVPLLRGQLPGSEAYAPKAPCVCVIDQVLADTYWPDGDPIGQRLCFGSAFDPAQAVTIVGVVGAVKQMSVTEAQAQGMVYSPFVQFPTGWFFVVIRSPLPAGVMAASLRNVVKELDPERAVEITTMEQMIDDSLLIRRSPTLLAALFGGVALVLCAVGTYGVLAYAASHRRREIGVRLALGATPRQVVRLFLVMGTRLLLGGFALGLLGAWAAGRAMRSVLFEVSPFSPMIIGGVAGLMGLVAMVAILIPALRAGAVDPCETLRHD